MVKYGKLETDNGLLNNVEKNIVEQRYGHRRKA